MHRGSERLAYCERRPITGLARAWLQLGGQFFSLSEAFFSFGVYIFRGSTNVVICTSCTNVEYCTARTKSVCCALHESGCSPSRASFKHVLHFMCTLCELPYICSMNCIHICLVWSADYIFLEILILMFFFYNYYLRTACVQMRNAYFYHCELH